MCRLTALKSQARLCASDTNQPVPKYQYHITVVKRIKRPLYLLS